MRLPRRYNQDVPFLETVGLPVLDISRGHLTGPRRLRVNRRPTNNDSRTAVDDVEDVRFFVMDFNVAVRRASVGLHAVSVTGNQRVSALLSEIVKYPLIFHIDGAVRSH